MSELNKIALKILSNGKGILAADESNGTMTKRLDSVAVPSTPENRLLFRETLFTSEAMKKFIGGVILYDETIKQISNSNKAIPELISATGAVPGIKVDTGAKVMANSTEEKITEGLDGLRERLKEYYKLGARFTKWKQSYLYGFYGSSGSVYWCHQGGYRLTMSIAGVYNQLKENEKFKGQIQLMPEDTDWSKVKCL